MHRPVRDSVARLASSRRRRISMRIAAAILGLAALIIAPVSVATAATTNSIHASAAANTEISHIPASVWVLYNAWYPTRLECAQKGVQFVFSGVAATYKCVEINRGYYFTWALYLLM
jgi:hypothetical protein